MKKTLKIPVSFIKFLANHDGILIRSNGFNIFNNKPITTDPNANDHNSQTKELHEMSLEIPKTLNNTGQ